MERSKRPAARNAPDALAARKDKKPSSVVPVEPSGEYDPELDKAMDENEAAIFLDCAVGTLQKKRVYGGGPEFIKFGRLVRYTPRLLLRYQRRNTRRSTSEIA